MSSYRRERYNDMPVDWMASEGKKKSWFTSGIGILVVIAVLLLILWFIISAANNKPKVNVNVMPPTNVKNGKPSNYQWVQPISQRYSYQGCFRLNNNPIQIILPQGGTPVQYANDCYIIANRDTGGTATKFGITSGADGTVRCFFNNAQTPHLPQNLQVANPGSCLGDLAGNPVGSVGALAIYNTGIGIS